jgi:predicted sulfurtransferase
MKVLNIAFYRFLDLVEVSGGLVSLKQCLLEACQSFHLKGKILLSQEGLNGSLAGEISEIRSFQKFLESFSFLKELPYRESYSTFVPFKRMLIKIKKQVIPSHEKILPQHGTAPRISAQELKRWIDEKKSFFLLDTRNDYEVECGTFQQATHLDLKNFRQFSKKFQEVSHLYKKPLVVFCTGGIRCEKASMIASEQGIEEVYQLDGGILKYFEQVGGAHYRGSCFVFDDRVTLDSQLRAEM